MEDTRHCWSRRGTFAGTPARRDEGEIKQFHFVRVVSIKLVTKHDVHGLT